ncbi:MAG: hypothetical protein KJT03_09980, partial [Verrucomicrobiae bacterium]|nr:hypothetical protein [Verrucomicrobiae bacterium]
LISRVKLIIPFPVRGQTGVPAPTHKTFPDTPKITLVLEGNCTAPRIRAGLQSMNQKEIKALFAKEFQKARNDGLRKHETVRRIIECISRSLPTDTEIMADENEWSYILTTLEELDTHFAQEVKNLKEQISQMLKASYHN